MAAGLETICFLTLYFDSATERAIEGLWQLLADTGVSVPGIDGHRPHITLAAYPTIDPAQYQRLLAQFAPSQMAFPIRLHALGVFPEAGVVFLAPRVTAPLLALHSALLTSCAALGAAPLKYPHNLGENSWMPHCTLARGETPAQVASIVATCIQRWQAIEAMAEGIGILVPPATVDLAQCAFASAT
jgi:2'-5' RNA ligase